MNNLEYLKNAKYGFMTHFGLYSLFDGEYKGKPSNEWVRLEERIPREEYRRLARAFNPIFFDADEWVETVMAAGMKYMVVTAKHHEGFAMFKSHVSDFNVVDATPFGRDIIGELAQSCKKYGMKLGLYYSQDLDWDEENGGGQSFVIPEIPNGAHNFWDYPKDRKVDYDEYFRRKVIPQVTELLTNYGDIFLIWFDCPWTITKEQSMELYDLVKSIRPDCLVSSRIGNGIGDYGSGGDNDFAMKTDKSVGEVPVTINGRACWTFSYNGLDYKSADIIIKEKADTNSKGLNYLLNIGVDHLGRIPGKAKDLIFQVADIEKNGGK